ncbi:MULTISPECIES: hypothetical protein [unclassified Kribbella]|uniref:hypothetical protein n=1 Tax=unclassified Kribbella TaxID=2644121 RepID=UPI0030778808
MLREDRLGTAQADLRRARDTGRTGGVEVDVVGGITGLILGVLVTNVFVTTQGRAVVLTWGFSGTRPGLLAAHRLRRRSYPALRADSVPPTEALRST